MRDNGTDRDVALSILAELTNMASIVAAINDDLYAAHITTQPTDQSAELGTNSYFSIVADNVKSYQWQFKSAGGTSYTNTTALTGYNTNRLTVVANANRDGMSFRCLVTGKDGVVVTSDSAALTVVQ